MCGRYTLTTPGEVIAEIFDLPEAPEVAARYNVAPTQEVAAIRAASDDDEGADESADESRDGGRRFVTLRWGLVPHWAKDPSIGNRMINARSESVAEKPAFRTSFKKRRCLVLADGFYEWQKVSGGKKQPWYFRLESGEPFAFAGLWSSWKPKDGGESEPLETCTLLTTDANTLVKKAHHRMPVILSPEDLDLWLDPHVQDREPLEALLDPFDPARMIAFPVSTRVNSPANDDPSVIEPQGEAERADEDEAGGEQQALF
jgi:putative SOS response-associated peptidase YedK